MKQLFSELNNKEHQVDVLCSSVTILLYSLCKMEVILAQMKMAEDKLVQDTFNICEAILQDWIKRYWVIGGDFFGYKDQNETMLLYESTELKVN